MIGQKRQTNGSVVSTSAVEFFSFYPSLYEFFLEKLRIRRGGQLQPEVFPILSVISMLTPCTVTRDHGMWVTQCPTAVMSDCCDARLLSRLTIVTFDCSSDSLSDSCDVWLLRRLTNVTFDNLFDCCDMCWLCSLVLWCSTDRSWRISLPAPSWWWGDLLLSLSLRQSQTSTRWLVCYNRTSAVCTNQTAQIIFTDVSSSSNNLCWSSRTWETGEQCSYNVAVAIHTHLWHL